MLYPMSRRFQFSLRFALASIAIVGVLLGIEVNRAARQQIAVAAIREMGGTVIYNWQRVGPMGERLQIGTVRKLLGDHLFAHVDMVSLFMCHLSDDDLKCLDGLSKLERLNLSGNPITGSGFGHLVHLTTLNELLLSETKVADSSLPALVELKRLEFLALDGTEITDAGLACLQSFSGLKGLALGESQRFSDSALEELENALPQCDIEAL